MRKKIKITVLAVIAVVLLSISFGTGYALAGRSPASQVYGPETIDQVWNIIFRDYVDKSKLDAKALNTAAIKGIVQALNDPYTAYLEPETYRLSISTFEGKFDGIGAQVGMKDKQPMIIAPIEGSPAEEAGIKAGDIILEIDGKSTDGLSLTEVVLSIRGPKGTTVNLLLLHQNETEPVRISVVRAEIQSASVRQQMRGDIAYIRISEFTDRTDGELTTVLENLPGKGATGIVLDLRSNPGGLLQSVIDVTSHFIKEGIAVTVVDNEGGKTASYVKTGGIVTDLPMVVLVDGYSASGSEVLSGALRDYGRAKIAGTKTFGKGSVNIVRHLKDGGGLIVTTARWLTPNGTLIEGKGLIPDYELTLTGDEGVLWAIDLLKRGQ